MEEDPSSDDGSAASNSSGDEIKIGRQIKKFFPLMGWYEMCGVCIELKIEPPIKKGRTTNFVERGWQEGTRKQTEYEGMGMRKKQAKTKRRRTGNK